jgi:effector-binding domain-containing protein
MFRKEKEHPMTTTGPEIEERQEVPYMGIRVQVPMAELGTGLIPQLHDEVMGYLKSQGAEPKGPPFIRYWVINMAAKLDIELGWPVAQVLPGYGRVNAGALPAGRYASLLYTGDYSGLMEANGVLIGWARENGITWDSQETAAGDAFGSRFESYITDPGDEPNPAKWETEVAIRLAD